MAEMTQRVPKSRVMMHVTDALIIGGNFKVIVACRKCRHYEKAEFNSTLKAKRGVPCPVCNKESN